jgi:hypothetical protein
MNWSHSRIMSVADDAEAAVVDTDGGWEAFPFGLEGGAIGVYPSRDDAIDAVEAMAGDVICCVGHLAEDSDK